MGEPIQVEKSKHWTWEGRKLPGYFAARFLAYCPSKPHQLVMKVPTDVVVEIYQATAERWEARTRPHGSDRLPKRFKPLPEIRCATVNSAMEAVEKLFYNRSGDWQLYSLAGLIIEPDEER